MFEYITGRLAALNPAEATVEAGGFGYRIFITLNSYSALQSSCGKDVKLYLYHLVREDDEALYGFCDADERDIFLLLISVSGVGPSVARMILSSLTPDELRTAILTENVSRIKGVKGIGVKTAQRLIVDLKDKVTKGGSATIPGFAAAAGGNNRTEAAEALVSLGFQRAAIEKVLDSVLADDPSLPVEKIIKSALKNL